MTKEKKNVKSNNVKKEVNKKVDSVKSSAQKEWVRIFKVLFGVLVFLTIFYLITVLLVSDGSFSKNEEQGTTIQYDEILAGSSFGMKDSEYLVAYYDMSDTEMTELATAVYSYGLLSDVTRLYTVDMSNGFNTKYATEEESNKSPKSASDLLINGPTLIKISDGKVVEYIEGMDSVIDYLS